MRIIGLSQTLAARLNVELLLTGAAAGFVIENLSPAGDRMIRGIKRALLGMGSPSALHEESPVAAVAS